MAAPMNSLRKEGFDCEFVEKPPDTIQSECPVCLQILREPYQAPCCGNSFCRVCIERIKTDNMPCPTCKEYNFETFFDKRLQRSLYGFQVYCSHKQEGCEWKGELGQLDNHLNLSPQPDKQPEGCEYSEIECIYCSELIKRCNIAFHQTDLCPKRPFSCEYCHSYESHYEDVINNHWPVCGYHPVQCPNECGTFPQRQALENHITRDCPKTFIDCDFHHVGCDVRLPRKDMPAHLHENLVTHMSLQAASYNKLLASHNELQASHATLQTSHTVLHDKVNKMESENDILKKKLETTQRENHQAATRMEDMEQQLALLQEPTEDEAVANPASKVKSHALPPSGYFEFMMENFEQHKVTNDKWYSVPFYSYPQGYKFCLRVDANGSGNDKGTHISVYLYLLKGEFDDHLKWPFRGEITVQLVDQEGEEKHYCYTIPYANKTSDEHAGRVTEGDRRKGWGRSNFISVDKLKANYLKNDTLCFRITKITRT